MAAQAGCVGCLLHFRGRSIAMWIVTIRARQRLSALNKTLRIAQRGYLVRNQHFFRQRIGPVREPRVTSGASIQSLIGG
jgi:hypothetical protein